MYKSDYEGVRSECGVAGSGSDAMDTEGFERRFNGVTVPSSIRKPICLESESAPLPAG